MTELPRAKPSKGTWVGTAYSDFAFFLPGLLPCEGSIDNDEIRTADNEEILDELRKIEKDFDEKQLNKKQTE